MRRQQWTIGDLRQFLDQERAEALATRDPLAIRYAHDRWDVVYLALQGRSSDEVIDLNTLTVGVKLAAQALGYTPQQVRRLIRERKLAAQKEGDQWRIPLRALL